MSQSFTCSVVTREGSFDAVVRNNIRLSALKSALYLEESVMVFDKIPAADSGPLFRQHGKINETVY